MEDRRARPLATIMLRFYVPCPSILTRASASYSPSSVIGGDYAPFLERYRTESAAALRTLAVQRDLRYGDNSRSLIDYFPAPASAPQSRPARLLPRRLLAGAVEGRSRRSSRRPGTRPGSRTRWSATRWRPRLACPTSSGSCRAALAWLHARADTLGFDPGRIVAAGSSAGAYLAAACADAGAGAAVRHRAGVRHLRRRAADRHVNQRCAGLDDATAAAIDLLRTRAGSVRRRRVG